jgi:hypothetical protein
MAPRRPVSRWGSTICMATALVVWLLAAGLAAQPAATSSPMVETGQVSVAGHDVPYRIRNLPVSSFPELPAPIAVTLDGLGCVIPQTYEAHRPENVIHASLERPGSVDWAVLCLVKDQVLLLVFFASASAREPEVLATAAKTDRLQPHDATGELGFNWGIDPANPKRIHEAQVGMLHRPPPPDHDCVADSTVDQKTVYHLYQDGAWRKVDVD